MSKVVILVSFLFIAKGAFASWSYRESQEKVLSVVLELEHRHQSLPNVNFESLPPTPTLKEQLKETVGFNFNQFGQLNIYDGVNCKKYEEALKNSESHFSNLWQKTEKELYEEAQRLFKEGAYCEAVFLLKTFLKLYGSSYQSLSAYLLLLDSYLLSRDFAELINTGNLFLDDRLSLEGTEPSFSFKFTLTSDHLGRVKEYTHYMIVRGAFEAIRGAGTSPQFLKYVLGEHEDQMASNFSKYMKNLSANSYLSSYPHSSRKSEVTRYLHHAFKIKVIAEILAGDHYYRLGVQFAHRWTPAYALEGDGYRRSEAQTQFLAAGRRYLLAMISHQEALAKESVNLKLLSEIFFRLAKTYKNLSELVELGGISEQHIVMGLKLAHDPYGGAKLASSIQLGPQTQQLIRNEVIRSSAKGEPPQLGLYIPERIWQTFRQGLTFAHLKAFNPYRVRVEANYSKVKQEVLALDLMKRDFGSVANFRQSYYYEKFQEVPLDLICIKKAKPVIYKIQEFGFEGGDEGVEVNIELPKTNSGVYMVGNQLKRIREECAFENGAYEMRYTQLRIWDTNSPKLYKVIFLWEDEPTLQYSASEAIDFLKHAYKQNYESFKKLLEQESQSKVESLISWSPQNEDPSEVKWRDIY